jgi:undecaprenyl diphosphate synthase
MRALLEQLDPRTPEYNLAASLDAGRIPVHVGVIMDGNGRWARSRNLPRVAGHKAGVEPVRMCVETCAQLGVEVLTLYAFSLENWKRPKAEVDTLWRLLQYYLHREVPRLMENGIRFRAIGRIGGLDPRIREMLAEAEAETGANGGMTLNLAINYGGRAEIVDAVNGMIAEAREQGRLESLQVDEQTLSRHLYTGGQPEPDLLIRTSGEMRISNFLLWQIAYAELYVTETYWPDFDRMELLKAVSANQKRERRFGAIESGSSRNPVEQETQDEAISLPAR